MQLTLRQADIDSALDAYVRKTIAVQDGFEIQTTLKATRGDEGATVFVNIVPEGTPRATPVAKTPGVRKARQSVAEVVAKAKTDAAPTTVVNEAGTVGAQPEVVEQAAVAVDPVDQPVVASPAPKSSLFGGLTRPVNA